MGAASVLSSRAETATRWPTTPRSTCGTRASITATKLTSVNSDDYYLTGWYDNFGCTAGKKVRVIIAVKKD